MASGDIVQWNPNLRFSGEKMNLNIKVKEVWLMKDIIKWRI